MGKIVIAVDGSEHADRAFQFYLENIHQEGNELVFIHALEYPYIPGQQFVSKDTYDQIFEAGREAGHKVEKKFKDLCSPAQIVNTFVMDFANPGELVLKTAKDSGASMIVLGTRGMGTVRRTILGSVSDYVLHHAHCPVCIARH